MATNLAVDEEIDGNVDAEGMGTALPTDEQNDTSDTGNGQNGISRRTRLLNLGRLLLHLVCFGYSLYLIWLLAYLKDNNNYWCLSFISILCNFRPFLLLCKAYHDPLDTGNGQNGKLRGTRLLDLGRLLLHLVFLGYSLYLIWLLAYLKDNNNYWFLSFIPILCNFAEPFWLLCKAYHNNDFHDIKENLLISYDPLFGVVVNLMACFTMLTRQAYYHRQPDEFVGPRFIILSLQASIILILLDFVLQSVGKQDTLLDYKDALTRMLLDFVDIFNMVEMLSANVCVGVGSFVSEDSSTERAIQAFCTMSFIIVLFAGPNTMTVLLKDEEDFLGLTVEQLSPRTFGEFLYSGITMVSGLYQNLPFLVIRIVVWAQYKLYSLGFLVKNVTVIVLSIAIPVKIVHTQRNFTN